MSYNDGSMSEFVYKRLLSLKRKMIVNITGKDLKPPRVELPDLRRRIAVAYFICELEDKPDKSEIYCIKTNLISSNPLNPDQILCFIPVKKGQRMIRFKPGYMTPFQLATRRLADGRFYLSDLSGNDIEIVQAALQITIRAPGEN